MKKYSIFSLYVISINHDDSIRNFICKKDYRTHDIIEVLTNKKIDCSNICNIESLSEYYSILERKIYPSGEPLKIDKREILEKYLTINNMQNDDISFKKEQLTKLFNGDDVIEKETNSLTDEELLEYYDDLKTKVLDRYKSLTIDEIASSNVILQYIALLNVKTHYLEEKIRNKHSLISIAKKLVKKPRNNK